ncbi:MAG: hypothetical protein EOM73_14015 [Bacteroidia bacterium]|nr:hypothetical protein [Bacteroidia bacterium]
MQQPKRNTFDKTGIGLAAGFLLPLVVFFTVYWFGENEISFAGFIQNMWQIHALVKLGSLCVFANFLVFWLFIRLKYDRAARGVLGATLAYALVILISKAF